MPRTPSRRLTASMLIVTVLGLLFVACGVPDPAAISQTEATDPSPAVVVTVLAESPVTPTSTATTGARCPDLLGTIATMDRATLEQCVAVETTALAQVAPTCPAGFDLSTITDDALDAYCGGLRQTADALQLAGTLLLPTTFGPTETPFVGTLNPPDYIPDRVKEVKPVPSEDLVGLQFLRSSTSVWQIGGLSDVNGYNYNHVWVWTKPPGAGADRATIGFFIIGDAETNEGPYYRMVWESPEDVGALKITGISGVTLEREQATGAVAFTTSAGGSGSFDLATQQWSFVP